MQNMASARNQEKQTRVKMITKKTTKSHANNTESGGKAMKEKAGDFNDELIYPQTLLKEIETRNSTIDQLRQELQDVKKDNILLKDELEIIREKQGESTAIEINSQHVVGKRMQREERSHTETMYPPVTTVTAQTPELRQVSSVKRDTIHYQDLKKVIDESLDERRFQNRERLRRARNIIVHGIKEEQNVTEDESAKKFLDTIQISYVPMYVARLGIEIPGATRPLKISFNNVNEKEIVMKALPKLKNSKLKVRVTHDLTIMDRKKISLWNLKAKTKNKEETGSFVWRVTGSPATTLRLTRFETKRDHTTVPTNNVQHNRALRRGLERPVKL